MVDLHSHILWGIDDGAKDKEMTLKMLRQAKQAGTKKIVATPHYLRDRYEVSYDELSRRYDDIKNLIEEEDIDIEVYLAQEVYFTDNILEMYNNKEIGTINGGKYMLIELPMREFSTQEVIDKLYELQVRGIEIIIAHPERYKPFIYNAEKINRFIDEGYLFQLNAGSVVGEFGKEVQKLAAKLLTNGIYNFIGSDAHRVEMRNTDISEAIRAIKEVKASSIELFEKSGNWVLNNDFVEFQGRKLEKQKRGILGFLKR